MEDAWFIRRRCRWGCELRPARWQGRALMAGYVALLPLIVTGKDFDWPVEVALLALATFCYIVIAWRMSAPSLERGTCD
ncbi:hypothetical protein ACLB0R_04970 [Sphingomonas sp. GlSt437]|uniref:hypothetical protein n=1 Tax=Sphingomonas sp. GlSt437 TaxID=3389970 RepID=UPI003A871847